MLTEESYFQEKIVLLKRKNSRSSSNNKYKLLPLKQNSEKAKLQTPALSKHHENFIIEKLSFLKEVKNTKKVETNVDFESKFDNNRGMNEIEKKLMLKVLTDNMSLLTDKKVETSERKNHDFIKNLQEKVAKEDFIRSSIYTLNRKLIEKKLEDHFVNNTSIMLVADIAKNLPKQSLESKVIWAKFFKVS